MDVWYYNQQCGQSFVLLQDLGKALWCCDIFQNYCDLTSSKLNLGSMCQVRKSLGKLFVEGKFTLKWGTAQGSRHKYNKSCCTGDKIWVLILKNFWIMGEKKKEIVKCYFSSFLFPFFFAVLISGLCVALGKI